MNALKQSGIGGVTSLPKRKKKRVVVEDDSDEGDTEGEE